MDKSVHEDPFFLSPFGLKSLFEPIRDGHLISKSLELTNQLCIIIEQKA
jgi:hypothetical protein